MGSVSTASNKVLTLFSYTPKLDPVSGVFVPVAKYLRYATPKDADAALLDLAQAGSINGASFNESVVLTDAEKWYKISLEHAPDCPDCVETGEPDCLFVLGIGMNMNRAKEHVNFRLADHVWRIFKKTGLNDESEKFYWTVSVKKGQSNLGPNMVVVNGSSVGYDTRELCLQDMTESAGFELGFDRLEG